MGKFVEGRQGAVEKKMADQPGEGQLQLFVKSINGKTRTVVVNNTDTIRQIKEQIRDKEGINPDEQRLIYAGKNLDDTKTVADYNLSGELCGFLCLAVCNCFARIWLFFRDSLFCAHRTALTRLFQRMRRSTLCCASGVASKKKEMPK